MKKAVHVIFKGAKHTCLAESLQYRMIGCCPLFPELNFPYPSNSQLSLGREPYVSILPLPTWQKRGG